MTSIKWCGTTEYLLNCDPPSSIGLQPHTRRGSTDQNHVLAPLGLVPHLAEVQRRDVGWREWIMPLLRWLIGTRGTFAEIGRREAWLVLEGGTQTDLELSPSRFNSGL